METYRQQIESELNTAKATADAPPADGCVAPQIYNTAHAQWVAQGQAKVDAALAHYATMPTVCVDPPPPGEPDLFGRKTFTLAYEIELGGPHPDQFSGVTFNQRTGNVEVLNQFDYLRRVDIDGTTINEVQITGPHHNDWESIQWLGDTGSADVYAILFEGHGRVFFVEIPYSAASVNIDVATTEHIDLPTQNVECVCVDVNVDPNILYAFTFGNALGGTLYKINRSAGTVETNPGGYDPANGYNRGIRGAFLNTNFCSNPIRLDHDNPNASNDGIGHVTMREVELATGNEIGLRYEKLDNRIGEGITMPNADTIIVVCEQGWSIPNSTFLRFEA